MSHTSLELVTLPSAAAQPALAPAKAEQRVSHEESGHRLGGATAEESNVSKGTTAVVLLCVVCITGISSLLAGLVTVAIPTIGRELDLGTSLLLWPISIYSLTSGCTLLPLGSVADVLGPRTMYLTGCILQSGFTLACGLARTGGQLIIFRAFAGIAISFCLPSAVSIITSTFPEGKTRNIAFASLGGGQPIGFSFGLTIGGLLTGTIGWRYGFYIAAGLNTVILVVGVFGLPRDPVSYEGNVWRRLREDIDWVGAMLASMSLAMISYAFAALTGSTTSIGRPATIATLIISLALVPLFIFWVGRQERLGRPAIIPNSLWRNRIFTCICIGVFLTWGLFNAVEAYQTLYFQEVQQLSPIQTAIRLLPAPISGGIMNMVMGLLTHRVKANWAIAAATTLTCVGCIIMSLVGVKTSFWSGIFIAIFLNPIGSDTLFTISNLLITSVFPTKTQALAGGVFNTVAQIGKSVGLATGAVVASSITARSHVQDKESPEALLKGYHAAFWYFFAMGVATLAISLWGLRNIGKVGVKRE